MIIFLTLCYCGILALLVKLNVIKLTLWWKLSPAAWLLLLLVVLFIPMQWGAPTGPITTYQYVVEIIPNVSGEVIEVPVQGLQPLAKGDVLFKIDPTPYEAKVDFCQSQLEDAKQKVEQLKEAGIAAQKSVEKTEADIELSRANQRSVAAGLNAAKASLAELKSKKEKVIAVRQDLTVQVAAGKREFDRVTLLVERKAAPEADLDIAEVHMTSLQAQLTAASADVQVATDAIQRGEADLTAAEIASESAALQLKQLIETELPRVKAVAREAEIAASANIDGKHPLIASAEAQLAQAQYDLDQTVVTAPTAGYIVGMTLQPGQRVANFPVRSWMSFVSTERTIVGIGVPQYTMRHIETGQPAELTFKLRPGKVFAGTVQRVGLMTPEGQIQPSGIVMDAPDGGNLPYGVVLEVEGLEEFGDEFPGGATGTAAIYTENAKATHLIRKVMLRMEAWLNYIKPW